MFGPWLWFRERLPMRIPRIARKLTPNFNFITLHYCYLTAWALLGSVIMYGNGSRMDYIDALFFACGSATQSGLNTIDVDKLALYQQVTMMLMTCVCTPIFIHGSVVFIRLYWFEKRFQNVVMEARSKAARTRTLSRRKSDTFLEQGCGPAQEERGVGDREIRIVRTQNGHMVGHRMEDDPVLQHGSESSGVCKTSSSEKDPMEPENVPVNQVTSNNIVWADDLNMPTDAEWQRLHESVDSPRERLPQVDKEKSIAFVENQRNAERTKLRIPGPRDVDRGHVPEKVNENEANLDTVAGRASHDTVPPRERANSVPTAANGGDQPLKNHITIDVPGQPRLATGASVYDRAKVPDAEGGLSPVSPGGMRLRNPSRSRTLTDLLHHKSKDDAEDTMPYLSWTPTIGRNSNFVDLSEEQREELGGIEYRALKLLAIILLSYFVGFHLLGMVCLTPWINHDLKYKKIVEASNASPTWWGFFTPASMFNDLGFTLTSDSMISFQFATLPLLLGTFLIIIGNTGFPCMLRFVIWSMSKMVPVGSGVWEELRFLLDHPRRCFTLLFPSKANWWLFWVLVLLNGVDLIFFIILDLNDPTVTSLPSGFRFLNGLFQAAATRTAGFAVVNIADLHPAIQVSYLIMMYISIFPIAMSMRQTNVYEEKSLGVWAEDDEDPNSSYLSHHLRRQLSFDLWFVFLGFFLIAIIEGSRLQNTNEYAFNLFSVLFEIVSAYGTVGLSLGFPNTNTSFSGQFRTLSKLIIIAMQIRGRHRGLPYALDRAILLPSESLHEKENEDATRRARRASSAMDPAGSDGVVLPRTATGVSRRSSVSGEQGRMTIEDRFKPGQWKRVLSGAFSNGPSVARPKRA